MGAVAKVWSNDILGKAMEDICKSAIDDFIASFKPEKGSQTESNKKHCKTALKWPKPERGGHKTLCERLQTKHSKNSTLFQDMFSPGPVPKANKWSTQTKLSVYGMADCADCQRSAFCRRNRL